MKLYESWQDSIAKTWDCRWVDFNAQVLGAAMMCLGQYALAVAPIDKLIPTKDLRTRTKHPFKMESRNSVGEHVASVLVCDLPKRGMSLRA